MMNGRLIYAWKNL